MWYVYKRRVVISKQAMVDFCGYRNTGNFNEVLLSAGF